MEKVVLVTGGTRGIGKAVSVMLKDTGYVVASTYNSNDAVAELYRSETGIATFKWDLADYEACFEGVEQVEATLGSVDILVNNAGITRDAPFHKMTRTQWKEVIDCNLTGVFNMTHLVLARDA